ncbi:hypothetical protein DFH27DRAFT_314457 [Peziza echinospora]|nr:hypothetical protein DFH27DRAFT_314457 [Peziza echinospora]
MKQPVWPNSLFTRVHDPPTLPTSAVTEQPPPPPPKVPATKRETSKSSGTSNVSTNRGGAGAATRVTITQTYFREDPAHLFTANSLRGVLERDGFFERRMTFIVVEGQQEWAGHEIARQRLGLGTPDRLWARDGDFGGPRGPLALPTIYEGAAASSAGGVGGGVYVELDLPSPVNDPANPTRIRVYVHIRYPRPQTSQSNTSTAIATERLQNTYTYYNSRGYPPPLPPPPAQPAPHAGPRMTFIIVSSAAPSSHHFSQKHASGAGGGNSTGGLSDQLKRHFRASNQLRIDRLAQNPAWIVLDVLSATNNSSWIDCLGQGPSWSFLFPPTAPPAAKSARGTGGKRNSVLATIVPFYGKELPKKSKVEDEDEEMGNNTGCMTLFSGGEGSGGYHPTEVPEKLFRLHRYLEACLRVKEHIISQRTVLERLVTLLGSIEKLLVLPSVPTNSGGGNHVPMHAPGSPVGKHKRNSRGSIDEIPEEEGEGAYGYGYAVPLGSPSGRTGVAAGVSRYSSSSTTSSSTTNSPSPPPPPPPRGYSDKQPQQSSRHGANALSSPPPSPRVVISPTSTYTLQTQVTAHLTTLNHHLHHLSHLNAQTQNLLTYLNGSTGVAHYGAGRTVAAVSAVIGPLAFLALVVGLIGGVGIVVGASGGGGGGGAQGWVYPVISLPVLLVVVVIVTLVRRGV